MLNGEARTLQRMLIDRSSLVIPHLLYGFKLF